MKLLIVLMLVVCGCGGAATPEASTPLVQSENTPLREWDLSGEPSVYVGIPIGHRDSRIEVVPLVVTSHSKLSDSESKDWHLIRVNGGDEELNGRVFLAKWRAHSEGNAYIANIKGEPRNMLYSPVRRQETWEHITERGVAWELRREFETVVSGEELLASYYEQVDSGMQEELAPTSRVGREQSQDTELDETREKLMATCKLDTLTVDWDTLEEGLMSQYPVALYCSDNVQNIINFCESYPNAVPQVETMTKVRCDFSRFKMSEGDKLIIEDKELVYYPSPTYTASQNNWDSILRTRFGEVDQVLEGGKSTLIFRYGERGGTVYAEWDGRFYPVGMSTISDLGIPVKSGIRKGELDKRDTHWFLGCDFDQLPLTRLVGGKRDKVLANAIFEKEALWKREPYFLARDTHGTYYYVDRYHQQFGGRHYRVFIGKRGMLKLTKLKGLVEDSEGTVFSTQQGELRLIINPKASALWIRGKKRSELTAVDPYKNRKLIYDELGVYLGENLGHLCDE